MPQGLFYEDDFVSPLQESEWMRVIDQNKWLNDKEGKRVQIYGYCYVAIDWEETTDTWS